VRQLLSLDLPPFLRLFLRARCIQQLQRKGGYNIDGSVGAGGSCSGMLWHKGDCSTAEIQSLTCQQDEVKI